MKIWKKGISILLAGSMVLGTTAFMANSNSKERGNIAQAAEKKRTLNIDGNTLVKAKNSAFRGIGAVTCNNSSRLLMDYKEEHEKEYWEIMNWLFNPKKGAGLSHVKIELGSDLDTSSGAEPATKRTAGQKANVNRGAGFMFAHDALSINPDITVDMLCWGMPAWVEHAYEKDELAGNKARYRWYKETLDAAYDKWGITFSYISANRNEKYMERNWTVFLRNALNKEKIQRYDYSKIKLVAADETDTMEVAKAMLTDKEYRDAVDVLGFHYNSYMDENVRKMHEEYQKEIWYSEGASVATDSIFGANNTEDGKSTSGLNGMLDIANRIIIGMAQSDMTLYEYQPAVASYYDGSVYFPKQLIRANSPWSGEYSISNGLVMTMHFTNFIKKGWKFVESGSYGDGKQFDHTITETKDNYLTAAEKATGDYSTVITNDSDTARTYKVMVSNLKKASNKVYLWETKSNDVDEEYDAHWLEQIGSITPTKEGAAYTYEIKVKPYSMVTLTTTKGQIEYSDRKKKTTVDAERDTKLALPYADNFEYKESYLKRRGKTPRYTSDVNGAFEVVTQKNGNHVLRQKINKDHLVSMGWAGSPVNPVTSLGDDTWKDYIVSADVILDANENAKNYAGICARYNVVQSIAENGYQLRIYRKGTWKLYSNQGELAKGKIGGMREGRVVNLKLKVLGNTVTAYINNEQIAEKTVKRSMANSGRIALTSAFYKNSFDNVRVLPVKDGITHITRVDDLNGAVQFEGEYSRLQSQSYRYFGRTVSTLEKKGAKLLYSFTGSGISLLGNNFAGAKLKIAVDGKEQESGFAIKAAEHRSAFYQLNGLEYGKHTLEISLLNSVALHIDALEIEGEQYSGNGITVKDISVEKDRLELAYGESASMGVMLEVENSDKLEKNVAAKGLKMPETGSYAFDSAVDVQKESGVVFTTSDIAVATVTSDGRVVANGAGSAVVTASLPNGKKAEVRVTVTELAITPRSGIRVGAGEQVRLKASYIEGINKGHVIRWKSSNKKLATVSSEGVVKTKKAGYVTITAVGDNGYRGKVVVHIRKAPYRIKAAKKMTLKAGKTKKLRYEIPSGCYASKVTFKSSNTSVAMVTKSGRVKAKKAGSCNITVKAYNGKKKTIALSVK